MIHDVRGHHRVLQQKLVTQLAQAAAQYHNCMSQHSHTCLNVNSLRFAVCCDSLCKGVSALGPEQLTPKRAQHRVVGEERDEQ